MKKRFIFTAFFMYALCSAAVFMSCGEGKQNGDKTAEKISGNNAESVSETEKNVFSGPEKEAKKPAASGPVLPVSLEAYKFVEINDGKEYEIFSINTNLFVNDEQDSVEPKEIIIPSSYRGKPVTSIGAGAFEWFDLRHVKVTIPDGITVIGRSAFKDCSGISRISIGKSVTKIGYGAFKNCKSLNSVNIPEALTYLGDDAFMECSNLQSEIIIPDAVTNSLRKAFYNCAKLPKVKIGAGVKKIDEMAFAGSGITEITIPSNVKSIENMAFFGCRELTRVIIEDNGVTRIEDGKGSFKDCSSLKTIYFGNKLEYIGEYAFNNCKSLESLTFPQSLTKIRQYAFNNCKELVSVTFQNSPAVIGENAFGYCNKLRNVDLGDSLLALGNLAFNECTGITEITLPASLKHVSGYPLSPFHGCAQPTIYVKKLSSAPSGWGRSWNGDSGPVYWER